MTRPAALAPAALATIIGGAWLAGLGHTAFLGIGMDLPGALAPVALMILMLARPLAPERSERRLALIAAGLLLFAAAASASGQIGVPPAAPMV